MALNYRDLGGDSTQRRIQKLKELHERASQGGGLEAIDKQHERRKLTARERLDLLLDIDSFQEVGKFVSSKSNPIPGDGVVTGFGTVNGQRIGVYSQDFTVMGGSLGRSHADKICKIQDACVAAGIPLIGINDSGGARIQEGVVSLGGYADIFYRNVLASGVIPQISAIMGPCAGGAVYSPALTDFVFMVRETSFMFLTGPDVIKEVLNEDVTFEELGGAITHNQKSGVAHMSAKNELECIQQIKRLLSFLPGNNLEDPPFLDIGDPVNRREEKLASMVPDDPNKPYDMKEVINLVVDRDSFFEIQPLYAPNMITAFARLGGHVIGIIANQPRELAGCLDINGSVKGARFIRFCDAFNIPIVTFQDVPGFLPGTNQEWLGIIKHGAKLLYAYCEATVPLLNVTTRKSYGGAYCVMSSKQVGGDWNLAWPTGEIAVMGAKGAVKIIKRKELAAAKNQKDKAELTKKLEDEYKADFLHPYLAAEVGYMDDIIDPRDTRPKLISGLEMLKNKSLQLPRRKHGNVPL
ncbi:acyl-CoA carboxylase subunit beta [bacterium]|nr:acyl-CoA carboxylase subunit beta [bacterium]